MNKIKFRICHEASGHKSIIYPNDNFMISLDGTVYENYNTKEYPFWENVFDADVSLQQWTGLQDRNGKDIYEGDIVCILEYDPISGGYSELRKGVVCYDNERAFFCFIDLDDYKNDGIRLNGELFNIAGDGCFTNKMTVVGNILETTDG